MSKKEDKPIISFRDFSFKYRAQAQPSLIGINLDIYRGEKILIAGPSGSGKSTLANCINGLIPCNYSGTIEGSVLIDGVETTKLSVFDISKIVGTVLQDTDGQFVGLSAGEDIAFSLENNCIAKEDMLPRVQKAADMTGIGDALEASPYDLSGGQKQRASMSGLLVDKVQVLLFDEPLANLDPATGKSAIALIEKLKKETEATVIIIEHRLEDVLYRPVDRVIVMQDGKILADMLSTELLCSDLLVKTGLREPLYITSLKYAGVEISAKHKPASVETLRLEVGEIAAVRNWYKNIKQETLEADVPVLLEVNSLDFTYTTRNEPALFNISFNIYEREMTAIVGTNGAGKSTLAKLICGFIEPDRGHIKLSGNDITKQSIAARAKHIGYVMQNPNQMICKPGIYDEVALGLRNQGLAEDIVKERVDDSLKTCGLWPFRNWPVSALSYGQKKRVTIASVLVLKPKIIILDEPTAGQDYRHYTEIMKFLCQLRAQGVTVLLITHDMHLMLEYAPRALVFSQGRLIADMSSAALLSDPSLSAKASLKETSLFYLANACGINDAATFTKRFVEYEKEGMHLNVSN